MIGNIRNLLKIAAAITITYVLISLGLVIFLISFSGIPYDESTGYGGGALFFGVLAGLASPLIHLFGSIRTAWVTNKRLGNPFSKLNVCVFAFATLLILQVLTFSTMSFARESIARNIINEGQTKGIIAAAIISDYAKVCSRLPEYEKQRPYNIIRRLSNTRLTDNVALAGGTFYLWPLWPIHPQPEKDVYYVDTKIGIYAFPLDSSNMRTVEGCHTAVAISKNDTALCPRTNYGKVYFNRSSFFGICITGIATNKGDIAVCDELSGGMSLRRVGVMMKLLMSEKTFEFARM